SHREHPSPALARSKIPGSDASATSPAYLRAARGAIEQPQAPHVRSDVRQTRRPRPRAHRCDNSSGGRSCTQEVTAEYIMKREQPDDDRSARSRASIDLYWLPLGAGGHSVRLNGRIYEAVAARLGRRPVSDLYHSALEVRVPEGRFVIEQAPMRAGDGAERGVVAEGAVGSRWAG